MIGSDVGRYKTILFACILITAIAVIFIAPAYSIQPTALRAWNYSIAVLAAIGVLVVQSLVSQSAWEFVAAERRRPDGDLLRLTCTLLI